MWSCYAWFGRLEFLRNLILSHPVVQLNLWIWLFWGGLLLQQQIWREGESKTEDNTQLDLKLRDWWFADAIADAVKAPTRRTKPSSNKNKTHFRGHFSNGQNKRRGAMRFAKLSCGRFDPLAYSPWFFSVQLNSRPLSWVRVGYIIGNAFSVGFMIRTWTKGLLVSFNWLTCYV